MTKADIEQIRIHITSGEKELLSMLIHQDGTLNRFGYGDISRTDKAYMTLGMTDGATFRELVGILQDKLVENEGLLKIDSPDMSGLPMKYEIIFMGPKPKITVYEFNLGTKTKDPGDLFKYFYDFVSRAAALTDEWYKQSQAKNSEVSETGRDGKVKPLKKRLWGLFG